MKTYAAAIAVLLALGPVRCDDLFVPPAATSDEVGLIEAFRAFAADPSPETAADVRFAPEVRLGLADRLLGSVGADEVSDPEAWVLAPAYFRGYTGPFSALELVQRQDRLDVTVGPHPHCASPPMPAPRAVEDLRRVSVQPSSRSIDSCLSWFTVDLFVDDEGVVRAVTLDLWEP